MSKKKNKGKEEISGRIPITVDFLNTNFENRTFSSSDTLDETEVKKMLDNILIATPVKTLTRYAKGNEWFVKTVDEELYKRMKGIENISELVERMIDTLFYGYSVFEIVYNEDFTMKTIMPIPREFIRYDYIKKDLVLINEPDIELVAPKFLKLFNMKDVKYKKGVSILNPLVTTFYNYNDIDRKISEIQRKYGDLIPVFCYPEELGRTVEGRKSVMEQAKQIREIRSGSVLAIPVENGGGLKDNFQYISLSDLKIDIHLELRKELESKSSNYLLGSSVTTAMNSTASFSIGEIQRKELERTELEILNFVKICFNKIYDIDKMFFIESDEKAEWSYKELLTVGEEIKFNSTVADLRSKNISILSQLKDNGFKLSKEAIAEMLNINPNELEEVAIKEE